jgi:hypothetical protein
MELLGSGPKHETRYLALKDADGQKYQHVCFASRPIEVNCHVDWIFTATSQQSTSQCGHVQQALHRAMLGHGLSDLISSLGATTDPTKDHQRRTSRRLSNLRNHRGAY